VTWKVANGNTVSAGAKDSSSAGNLIPDDKRYSWPPQNDGNGVKRQTVLSETEDSWSLNMIMCQRTKI
jgi:hypothetical protein